MIYEVNSKSYVNQWGLTGKERIVQNVMNLVRTKMYEVPFSRMMGIDPDMIDSKMAVLTGGVVDAIIDLVAAYEPRATVLEVAPEGVDDNGNVIFNLKLEV